MASLVRALEPPFKRRVAVSHSISSRTLRTFIGYTLSLNGRIMFCVGAAENPYAKVKRTDTMESETAEADENETDTDNYDVVDALHTVDETKKSSDASPKMVLASNSSENATSFLPPPLPLPLRGSHSSLASGSESGSHAPRPPPRGRRVSSIALSHSGSSSNLHRPGSLVVNEAEGDDTPDGAAEEEGRDQAEGLHEPGAPQIHFSGDSQTSQDSSELFPFLLVFASR